MVRCLWPRHYLRIDTDSRSHKQHAWPSRQTRNCGSQVIDGALTKICANRSFSTSCLISLDQEFTVVIGACLGWETLHTGSLIYGVKTLMVGKDTQKPLELPGKVVNKKPIRHA